MANGRTALRVTMAATLFAGSTARRMTWRNYARIKGGLRREYVRVEKFDVQRMRGRFRESWSRRSDLNR